MYWLPYTCHFHVTFFSSTKFLSAWKCHTNKMLGCPIRCQGRPMPPQTPLLLRAQTELNLIFLWNSEMERRQWQIILKEIAANKICDFILSGRKLCKLNTLLPDRLNKSSERLLLQSTINEVTQHFPVHVTQSSCFWLCKKNKMFHNVEFRLLKVRHTKTN